MKLEVVDKNLISAVRLATVREVIGGRLHIKYEESENEDEGFWCHERSPLIHPIGWAQIIGHALKGKPGKIKLNFILLSQILFVLCCNNLIKSYIFSSILVSTD